MEDHRLKVGVLGLLLVFILSPCATFAYEVKTHEGITQATVETYSKAFSKRFQSSEISAIVRGSSGEDADERPVNHFFDPVNERGLTVGPLSWVESKLWAQDTEKQANFCIQRICFSRIGYADKYFSSPTDYSWDRAIYEYVYGNKERGLEGLGHILHLLQDASVPAHVRNDQHINNGKYGDFDPYEQYASRYGLGDVPLLSSVMIPQRQGLSNYFDALAGFTNGHFLSKDTLFTKYDYPRLDQLDIKDDGFAYETIIPHKVSVVRISFDKLGREIDRQISLISPKLDPNQLVLSDYWSILSKEAIRNGAGVIDLFFKEVEKEKQTQILKKKNVSQQEIDAKNVALKGFSLVKKLYGSSLDESDVSDLMDNQSASAVNAFNTSDTSTQSDTQTSQPKQEQKPAQIQQKTPVKEIAIDVPRSEIGESPLVEETKKDSTKTGAIVPITNSNPGGIMGSGGGSAPRVSPETPTIIVSAPVFTSPTVGSQLATTSVTLSGTADANALITFSITAPGGAVSTATTSASSLGVWNFSGVFLEGTTAISATASDQNGNTSTATNFSLLVDTTAPSLGVFSLLECTYSLATDVCATVGTAHPQVSAPSSDISYYNILVDSAVSRVTSLSAITLSTGSHTVAVAAYDAAGNGATSSPVTIESLDMPAVVNEVGWMGTPTSTSAKWLEIYNRSSHPVDMSQINLTTSDGLNSILLSGTLVSGAYYFIEKDDANTYEAADFVSSALTLSSTPTQVTLSYIAGGNVTSTIDATPAASACGSVWCAGTNDSDMRSMERLQPGTAGTLASNWGSNNSVVKRGQDSAGTVLNATIKYRNSVTVDTIGYSCNSDLTRFYEEGGSYQNSTGDCRFYDPALIGLQHRVALFVGTVGNSTEVYDFSTGPATDSYTHTSSLPSQYQVQGQDFFAVIFLVTPGPMASVETAQFMDYFTTGVGSIPNSYGILHFKWGP